jgi:4-diphosphocytidyl-2-C-methyl-D-erythritol kinase
MLLRAFAKINLDLRILGRRADGFHEIRTTYQTIDWCDEIEIDHAPRFEFIASDGPQDETNLVVRAVRLFEQSLGREATLRIRLTKNIPSGAGLAGGSADAAVTLMGLQRLYAGEVQTDPQREARWMRALGSDVLFFSIGGRAIGTGRGDELRKLDDLVDYWLVLVHPGFSILSKEAYSWLTLSDKSNNIEGFRAQSFPDRGSSEGTNDFEAAVFARFPQLDLICRDLGRSGAFRAALSGSGSVVYGQFRSEPDARSAAGSLSDRYAVRVTRPLSRADYVSRIID